MISLSPAPNKEIPRFRLLKKHQQSMFGMPGRAVLTAAYPVFSQPSTSIYADLTDCLLLPDLERFTEQVNKMIREKSAVRIWVKLDAQNKSFWDSPEG